MTDYHHMYHEGYKIQVDSAIRDGGGAKIDSTYVKKTDTITNATNATNALNDRNGDQIDTTYLKQSAISTISVNSATNDGDGNEISTTYVKLNELLNKMYPVGAIYTSTVSTSPSTLFGGTWEAFGQGRVLIGAGTGTDKNNTQKTFAVGETDATGEYGHTLITDEMPSHTHSVNGDTDSANATHSHTINFLGTREANMGSGAKCYVRNSQDGGSGFTMQSNSDDATHSHGINLTSGSTGGGQSHNNIQPYVVVYMWKRTA